MLSDAVKHVPAVIDLLGDNSFSDDAIEEKVMARTGDAMESRRLIDWIPEVFAYALISHHLKQFELTPTFDAQSAGGDWLRFNFKFEPIVAEAAMIATRMLHDGPRDSFRRIAERSSTLDAANNALNANSNFRGTLSGPAFIGIPAEIYAGRDA
jgi:hypothetical protein